MSTWTSDRAVAGPLICTGPVPGRVGGAAIGRLAGLCLGLASLMALPGCLGALGSGSSAVSDPAEQRALRRVSVAQGRVVIEPPRGYCVDPASLGNRPAAAFALIASCQSLTGRLIGPAVEPAVITLSVVPARNGAGLPGAEQLAGVLGDDVKISEIEAQGIRIVQVEGGEATPADGRDERHWRAVLRVNDRLVGLALYAAQGSSLSGPAGASLLRTIGRDLQQNSPRAGAPATAPATAPSTAAPAVVTSE